jgi:hypothetical protein
MWTVGLLIIVLLGMWILRKTVPRASVNERWPLIASRLLSEREQALYQRLVAMYPEHVVLAQVALSQLIDVRPDAPNRRSVRNRYAQLVADFVLCRRDFSVLAVIELDDSTHERADRQDADRRKTLAVEAAGLRLVRFEAGPIPSEVALRAQIDACQGRTESVPYAGLSGTYRSSPGINALLPQLLSPVIVLLALGAGWVFFSRALSFTAQKPLNAGSATSASSLIPTMPVAVRSDPIVAEEAEQKRLEARRALAAQQAADALATRKQKAWAAYFFAPPSCEHPPTWADTVECANQFMRARKQFERQWQAQQATAPPNEVIVQSPQ